MADLYAAKAAGVTTSDLYTLDAGTAAPTSIGASGFALTGLASDPTTGTLYGVTSPGSGSSPKQLVTIDGVTGAATLVGALGGTISDIAFDSAGNLYGWAPRNGDLPAGFGLCTINKATGAATLVGGSNILGNSGGLAFTDANVLYVLLTLSGSTRLYTANTGTGVLTLVGNTFVGGSPNAATFDAANLLWWLRGGGGVTVELHTLDIGTLTNTTIGTPGGTDFDALAWGAAVTPPPPPDGPATRAAFSPWRFIVTSLESETLTLLDNRATGRRAVFTLNAPAYHEGQVGSDDPEINLPWPDADSPAFLAPSTRLIYGFQREPGADPPWVCRFGGIVMSIEDEGADVPTSRYTAYDPWQLLMARPIRDPGTPFSLPGIDGLTFEAGSRASDIAAVLLAATELEDGETGIDFSDDALITDTDALAADITFDQGTSVGEAWQQLCDTGTLDIVLIPMYEPITAPGKVVQFSTWKPPNALTPEAGGTLRADAVMGWDRAGKSLTGISRLIDGTRLANVVQFYANQTPVPVQIDAASILEVGQYWAQQFFPGTGNDELVALMAVAELAIRRHGQRSISIDPGPERTFVALRDYGLRDYVPVWASRRLREPLGIDYDIFDPDIPSAAGYLRIYQIPIEIADDGTTLVRGIMTGKDVG